ncbi:hypothetical protein D3C85_1486870 [compost metagenome]
MSAMMGAKPQPPKVWLKAPVKYSTMDATRTSVAAVYMARPRARNSRTIRPGT